MLRRFTTMSLLAILLVVLLSACGTTAPAEVAPAEEAPAAEAPAEEAAEPVEMVFWFSGTDKKVAFMQAAVDEYNEHQDNVQITMVETPDSKERIGTALVAGEGPDIMRYNHNLPWYWGIESVYPLNDFVNDPEIGIDPGLLFPAAREMVQYAGIVQAIPINVCPGGLFYNREIFAEAGLTDEDAPETWEEVEALAVQLAQKEGDDVTRWGLVNGSKDWMLQEILLSNGGDWVNDDLTAYVDKPENLVEGLEWWSSLHNELVVMPIPTGVTWAGVESLQQGSEAFIRGDAAMSGFSGLCGAAKILDANPDLDIGGVLSPLGPSSGGIRTVSPGFGGLFVMADAVDPREGYLFAKWFLEEKAGDYALVSPGSIPSTTAALENPKIQEDSILGFGKVLEDMEKAELRTFHVFPGRLDVRSEEPALAELVLLEQATAQEAVDAFLEHATEVFKLYETDLDEFRTNHQIVW
ncbi:extracellular solute-binding protein [Chloroflexota bacterium]